MKFKTKLWQRSPNSYATTVPKIVLINTDEGKKYRVIWELNEQIKKWTVSFEEVK